jgi:intergrase/recombinase
MTIFDIFKKQGINGLDDLNDAEKATYQQWQAILARPDTTIADLKALLPKELGRANIELRKHENSKEKDSFYKAYTTLCEFILTAIAAPEKEREQLKSMLKQKYGIE